MTFYVGQKVVCIRSYDGPGFYGERFPALGQVVTIRNILNHQSWPAVSLRFYEITNPVYLYREGELECSFDSRRFRPVAERKTDISIFQKMLTDKELTPCL